MLKSKNAPVVLLKGDQFEIFVFEKRMMFKLVTERVFLSLTKLMPILIQVQEETFLSAVLTLVIFATVTKPIYLYETW